MDTLNNQKGMALLMVMTAITLLAFLLADFTFESKVNKIKVTNNHDRLQARLNAESGLKFALAKLKLYKEGRNLLEKNENAKQIISPSQLESILTQPFIYPLPVPKGANIIQRNAALEFEKNMLLKGELRVMISLVSGFLNPNNLIIVKKNNEEDDNDDDDDDDARNGNTTTVSNNSQNNNENANSNKSPNVLIEEKLIETLSNAIVKKREEDAVFDAKYGNIDPILLIKEIKFVVNRQGAVDEPEIHEISARYRARNITPKHGPFESIDELYSLDGWDDAIVDLIKDQLTVHEAHIIAVNELDTKGLKILFPDITDIQIEEFFRYRDGDAELKIDAQEFKTDEDFKNLIVGKLGVLSEAAYNERIKEFLRAGLKIGVAGKLYKVESVGSYGRAVINLMAYIDLPILPTPSKKSKRKSKQNSPKEAGDPSSNPNHSLNDTGDGTIVEEDENLEDEKKAKPQEFMEPRIKEIIY